MSKFETFDDIINREGLPVEEKIAPVESVKFAQEQINEIKSDITALRISQKKISDEIDKQINSLSDSIKGQEHYQKEIKIRDLQTDSTIIGLKIEDRLERIQSILSTLDQIKDLSQIAKKNYN